MLAPGKDVYEIMFEYLNAGITLNTCNRYQLFRDRAVVDPATF
jgi:hypothetical protein